MASVACHAGWTVVSLNPPDAVSSRACGIGPPMGVIAGYAETASGTQATVWGMPGGGSTPLCSWRPVSHAYGADPHGYDVVGDMAPDEGGLFCAATVWSSPSTFENLHPAWANASSALAAWGGQQVGWAGDVVGPTGRHASLWSGTASSFVDLNPAGASYSCAYGVYDGRQVGCARIGTATRAGMWTGTAGSWVSLSPAGATTSCAYGIYGEQQVGQSTNQACIWSGTAESWVTLRPASSQGSCAVGISGGKQVGWARFDNQKHAGMWRGTAQSWVDLHAVLPAGVYSYSEASAVFDVSSLPTLPGMPDLPDEAWIAGYARNIATGQDEGILWHYVADPVPEPSSFIALAGGLVSLLGLRRRRGQ